MGREKFSGPCDARHSKTTRFEILVRDCDGAIVAVGSARYLTEIPVMSAGVRHHDCRSQFRLRQIRKRERHQHYRSFCRCAHAASSSGRFQSSASALSLSNAGSGVSGAGSSSRIVTKARRAHGNSTCSASLTVPCSSTTASTVLIIPAFYRRVGRSESPKNAGVHGSNLDWRTKTETHPDGASRPVWQASPEAVALPADLAEIEQYPDLMRPVGGNYQYLRDTTGLIEVTSYYGKTTATETVAGEVAKLVSVIALKRGDMGASVTQTQTKYIQRNAGGATVNLPGTVTVYASACLKANAICSSEKCFFPIRKTHPFW